jgi:hypothetical protein
MILPRGKKLIRPFRMGSEWLRMDGNGWEYMRMDENR